MSTNRARTAVGCLGLLCFPVAIVLTLVWMRNHERIALYVGSGALILLGLVLVVLWLGWWVRSWYSPHSGTTTNTSQARGRAAAPPLCQLCQRKAPDWYCETHRMRLCIDCSKEHQQAGECRWWMNPTTAATFYQVGKKHNDPARTP